MKKKVALLLALVMTLSLLPMNVFGQTFRPGQITPSVVPHGDVREYVVAIDAAALSNQPLVRPGMGVTEADAVRLFLEIEVRGGGTGIGVRSGSDIVFSPGAGFNTASPAALALFSRYLEDIAAVAANPPIGTDAGVAVRNFVNRDGNLGRTVQRSSSVTGLPTWFTNDGWSLYNVARIPLDTPNLLEGVGVDTAIAQMEGWLNVGIPIRADQPDAYLSIRLRFETTAGAVGTISTLASGPLTGGWANGVTIESRGIVPMSGNMVRLNSIRITEEAPGRLVALSNNQDANRRTIGGNNAAGTFVAGPVTSPANLLGVMRHIVRLEAPRGFRWDTGAMFGLPGAGNVTATSNISTVTSTQLNPIAGHNNWVNPVTDTHEIFIQLDTTPRGVALGAASTLAHIDINNLALVALSGAPTDGEIAINVTVGTIRLNADGSPVNAWDDQGLAVFTPGTTTEGGFIRDRVYIIDQVRVGDTVIRISAGSQPDNFLITGRAPTGTATVNPPQAAVVEGVTVTHARTGEFFYLTTGTTVMGGATVQPRFGALPADHQRAGNWRRLDLVVATREHHEGVRVEVPAVVNRVSGRTTAALTAVGNDRFLRGDAPSLVIIENHIGAMFDIAQPAVYEFRPAQEGVSIIDAQVRAGRANARGNDFGWVNPATSNANFVTALTEFENGSLIIAPRSLTPYTEVRFMEVGLMLSIEGGFEAKNGGTLEIDVFRNGIHVGTGHIVNVTDPIAVEQGEVARITRDAFDVLALTPVAGFTVVETAAANLAVGDELRFALQATQDGRLFDFGAMGQMDIVLGAFETNTAQSNIHIEPIHGTSNRFRVVRPSRGVPGQISFNEVFVHGPTIPGIEWHVVVYGPQITSNSHRVLAPVQGAWTSIFHERAVFGGMAYSANILSVGGSPVIDIESPGGAGPVIPPRGRLTLRPNMPPMIARDGSTVDQPMILHNFGQGYNVTMVNPRIFADFIGGEDISFNAGVITFNGPDANGNNVVVTLTVGSSQATINGVAHDIATFAGASGPPNSVNTIIVLDRSFVPARFLANAFLLPISFDAGTVIIG